MILWKRKLVFCLIFMMSISFAHALSFRIASIEAPPTTRFSVHGVSLRTTVKDGKYSLYLPADITFPFTLKATGPMGGIVINQIYHPKDFESLKIEEGIVLDKNSRPEVLEVLPLLCPRVEINPPVRKEDPVSFIYNGKKDKLNNRPIFQLLDRDVYQKEQYKVYTEMDEQNLLLLKKVRITNDYENSQILDYQGPNPLTGEEQIVYEGEGGFYANLHYAIVPFNKKILTLDRQTLLHLAQGSLSDIDREELMPKLRAHSLIPGPFVSSKNQLYQLCEWGDTTYQAPEQVLEYKNMALWDWDYSIPDADHVLLIVWEGDEEAWMYQTQLLSPFTLTDDVVGIFEIKKEETVEPLVLRNEGGDFEITVETGDF